MIVDDELAHGVSVAYFNAERRLLETVKSYLLKDLDVPEYQLVKLAQVQALRAEAFKVFQQVNPVVANYFEKQVRDSYKEATTSAYADIGTALTPEKLPPAQQLIAVQQIEQDIQKGIESAQRQVLRNVEDVYRTKVSDVIKSTLTRGMTRQQATVEAVDSLAKRGLTEFTDQSGRNWTLPNYTEMAVRTGTRQALVRGYEAVLDRNHLDLVVVQPGPRPCAICDRWARSILTRDTTPQTLYGSQVPDLVNGGTTYVEIDGSLSDARADGFQHPNCRCRLRAYIPGATDPKILDRPPWDEDGYRAQQYQRSLENKIRKAKLEAAGASPDTVGAVNLKVEALQAQMRDHLDTYPYLKRQSAREQISGRFAMPGDREAVRLARENYKADTKTRTEAKTSPMPKPDVPVTVVGGRYDVADLSKVKRLDKPLPVSEVLVGANPGRNIGNIPNVYGEFNMNCSHVVNAVELRARGYDVIAKPIGGAVGRYNSETATEWRDADGKVRFMTRFQEIEGGTKVTKIRNFTADWEDGARGFISGQLSGSGHIFNIEKIDGNIVIHEGQLITSFDEAQGYIKRLDIKSASIMRVDDLVPTNSVLTDIVEESTPERLAEIAAEREIPRSAAYVRERIVRIEQRLAMIDTVRAEMSGFAVTEPDTMKRIVANVTVDQLDKATRADLEKKLKLMKDFLTRT
jgi:hypothetical protein